MLVASITLMLCWVSLKFRLDIAPIFTVFVEFFFKFYIFFVFFVVFDVTILASPDIRISEMICQLEETDKKLVKIEKIFKSNET